jgi:hypothetical protein
MSTNESDRTTRRSIEEARRHLTTDVHSLNTLLLDVIHRRPFLELRRTTARAIATRIRDKAEGLRVLLLDPIQSNLPSNSSTTDVRSYNDIGDTSVQDFRTAIRAEAVQLAIDDLTEQFPGTSLSTSFDNFHDPEIELESSTQQLQVACILQNYYSCVFHCSYNCFAEQVRLSLALQRDRSDHEPSHSA